MNEDLEVFQPAVQTQGPIPTGFMVGGHEYVLATRVPQVIEQQHPTNLTRINGIPHIRTAEGYQPYHANPHAPPWIKNHYTRGTMMLITAAVIGTIILVVAIGLFAVVTLALAHAVAVGVVVLVLVVGSLAILSAITKSRHGYAPRR